MSGNRFRKTIVFAVLPIAAGLTLAVLALPQASHATDIFVHKTPSQQQQQNAQPVPVTPDTVPSQLPPSTGPMSVPGTAGMAQQPVPDTSALTLLSIPCSDDDKAMMRKMDEGLRSFHSTNQVSADTARQWQTFFTDPKNMRILANVYIRCAQYGADLRKARLADEARNPALNKDKATNNVLTP